MNKSTNKAYKKYCLVIYADNDQDKNFEPTQIQQAYNLN